MLFLAGLRKIYYGTKVVDKVLKIVEEESSPEYIALGAAPRRSAEHLRPPAE